MNNTWEFNPYRKETFTITEVNWLKLFKQIIAVYSENRTKAINIRYKITDLWSSLYI
jgi:hypothetical protein